MRGGARLNAGRKRGIGLTYDIRRYCEKFISEMLNDDAIKLIATQQLANVIIKEKEIRYEDCVYLIESGGLIKIGYSSNFKSRIKSYKTHNSNLNILGVFQTEKAFNIESRLHKKYKDFRVNGEWFDLPKDVLCELLNYFNDGQEKI